MRLAAALVLTAMACGGQSAPAPESTGVRTVGSQGDGPSDADPSTPFEAGTAVDASDAADWFADAAACASRPVADCNACDADSCPMPMLGILDGMVAACTSLAEVCRYGVTVDLSPSGCVTALAVLPSNLDLERCLAGKLAAERFPLADCTFQLVRVRTVHSCGPK